MKWAALSLLATASLALTGSAVSGSTGCCREAPVEDLAPQWSPDGSRIAFVRWIRSDTSRLLTVDASGGGERQLADLGYDYARFVTKPPQLAPDWTKLALVKGTGRLKIENADGSAPHEIGSSVRTFSWSPDSRRLAFDQFDGASHEIFVVESDGTGLRSLGSGESPAWSPSGDKLAFVEGSGLYVMDSDGGGRRLVLDSAGRSPSWSPTGDRIAFLTSGSVVAVSLNGTVTVTARTNAAAIGPPLWSRDGTFLAVSDGAVVSVVRTESGEVRDLGYTQPSWSPVANELAAIRTGPCLPFGVYRVLVTGSGRRLTLDCQIRGTPGKDVLFGTSLPDVLIGLGGDDTLYGEAREDHLLGGPGADKLLGGDWGDVLEGGTGADKLVGGNFQQDSYAGIDDILMGGPGPDELKGGPGFDRLYGHAGNDVLRGNEDSDGINGGPGNDRIYASGDSERGFGGQFRDSVTCGRGRDVVYADTVDRVSRDCEIVRKTP